ncbi:hypothetical protein HYH03_018303 [Edaphochlamys debaryana]|uniref:Uncharacterized protein n=1 Tax=Edaphochlamys debaryana TaxID=47281 RepID=A0A835XEU6_9CHLO|nr:hypothetical protein HYH03_018303 [Edaphochlamys debaryana]|eukprot:KAG2482763.1 hypothetical protein HYH03_018303 [Edaphochlamys debaryana]
MRLGFHLTATSQQPGLPWLAQQVSLSSPTHITPSSQPLFLRALSDPAKAVHKGTGQTRPNSTGVPPVKPRGPPQPKPPAQAAKEPAGKPGGIKELHFRVKTEEKDTQTKMRRVEGWLEHGIRSKLVVKFKVGDADEALAASQLLDALLGRLAGKGSPQGAKQQFKDTCAFDEMMVRLQRMMASVKARRRRQGKRLRETGAELRQRLDDKDREVARLQAALQAAAEHHKRHAVSMKMQLSVAICLKEEAEDSMRIMADQQEADAAAVAELRRQLDAAQCSLAAAERDVRLDVRS